MASWNLEAAAGAPGTSLLWRGNWSSALSYNPNDGVASNGSSYLSKTNNTNKIPSSNPADWDVLAQGLDSLRLPRGYLSGMILSNNVTDASNDIDISAGSCRGDADLADIYLPSVITKQLDVAWTAGTNQGGRDTGAISDATWHVFAIRNPSTLVCDVLFSLSISAPTMPSGFTQKRRIASLIRRAGAFLTFIQMGDYFQYPNPYLDVNAAAQTPGQFGNVSIPSVPTGMKFLGHFVSKVYNSMAGAGQAQIRDPDQGSSSTGTHAWTGANVGSAHISPIWTSPGGVTALLFLWAQTVPASSATSYVISVIGYWDTRGKND